MKDIRLIAEAKGTTLHHIADHIGITYQSLYDCLKNGNPTLKRLKAIADALDVDVVDLFDKPSIDTSSDFIALIRHNRQTYSFDTPEQLKEFVKENLKDD